MTTDEQAQIVKKIAANHNDEARKHNFNWIRTSVTILTPSLALLIGLQGNNLSDSNSLRYFLALVVFSMTAAILLGLLALQSEAKAHVLARNAIIDQHNSGAEFDKIEKLRITVPKRHQIALECFPIVFFISVFLLGVFGLTKYVI